ncbi:hypothetical protein Poli38472_011089 [Pythium oligandrum]|uniref:Uncharacterized protein n=1 Tax=Pythium oligandrum TaxID=41045 RepID=A0A8K1FNM1_PYTOL|nr:hypothetical protein Poli38472_011089 [Pythium oligandrum]|eukprot:TMW67469.1 hypothetical protein Poli38472_011089 [Pythium oligandrum]
MQDAAWCRIPSSLVVSDREERDERVELSRFDQLKAAARRKRRRPTTPTSVVLAPISPQRQQQHASLPHALVPFPPLQLRVLERQTLVLNVHGEPTLGTEALLQYQEVPSPPRERPSPLHLPFVPRKCVAGDELALMPCHSLQYRLVPSLAAEQWREPIRDRNKNWAEDELNVLLMLATKDQCKMTRYTTQQTTFPRKWRRWESQKLHIHGGDTKPKISGVPGEVLLRNLGAMISESYCIVSIYGVGLYGRLYSEGLAVDRNGTQRHLRVEAYEPSISRRYVLLVTLSDLERVFVARPELLVAGKKHEMLKKVVSLLYFEYHASEDLPQLCLSAEEQLNAAAQRRLEREARLRWEEEQRLRALALLMRQPKRARHRVVCDTVRCHGQRLVVSIYQYPTQVRNFVVQAYHPSTSRTFSLSISVVEAARLAHVRTQPHQWTTEDKVVIAKGLLPLLELRGIKKRLKDEGSERMALGLRGEERMGAASDALVLRGATTEETKKTESMRKYMHDGEVTLHLTLQNQREAIHKEHRTTLNELSQQITQATATIMELEFRDQQLQEQIEEINSGKGVVIGAIDDSGDDKKRYQEQRRGYKAARKTIKDEKKTLQARLAGWQRDYQVTQEKERIDIERVEQQYDKGVTLLRQQAEHATMAQWWDASQRHPLPGMTSTRGNCQRTKHGRSLLTDDQFALLQVAGACKISSTGYRYTVFSIETDWFRVDFYDPRSSTCHSLRLMRLELIGLTKQQHEAQLQVPALAITSSEVLQKLQTLEQAYEDTRSAMNKLKALKKNIKKRQQAMLTLRENCKQQQKLRETYAPWDRIIRCLCERLTIQEHVVLDRCVYRANLSLVSVETRVGGQDDVGKMVDCDVRVTQTENTVEFRVDDPLTGETWTVLYPDSEELVKEFAVETQLEQQMHLEAIAMTLFLYSDEETGQRAVRLEE